MSRSLNTEPCNLTTALERTATARSSFTSRPSTFCLACTFTPRTSATGSSSPAAVAFALGSCEATSLERRYVRARARTVRLAHAPGGRGAARDQPRPLARMSLAARGDPSPRRLFLLPAPRSQGEGRSQVRIADSALFCTVDYLFLQGVLPCSQ